MPCAAKRCCDCSSRCPPGSQHAWEPASHLQFCGAQSLAPGADSLACKEPAYLSPLSTISTTAVLCPWTQSLSPTLCDPCTEAHQDSLSFTSSWSLLKFMSTESVTPSHFLILYRLLLLLPSIFPSIRFFSNESIRSFSFSVSPSIEYSGLISFRIDWFDLLPDQRTLKSLLQHRSLKASILQHSAFLMVQLAHLSACDYWKNHSFVYTDLCLQNDVSAF